MMHLPEPWKGIYQYAPNNCIYRKFSGAGGGGISAFSWTLYQMLLDKKFSYQNFNGDNFYFLFSKIFKLESGLKLEVPC